MKCAACDTVMDRHVRHGVTIDHCPACGGVWLDKGELDHLIAAVRPAVTLSDPDPAPKRPQPPRPDPAPSLAQAEPARERQPEPERRPTSGPSETAPRGGGAARRYGGRFSQKGRRNDRLQDRLEDLLEEIFDFD